MSVVIYVCIINGFPDVIMNVFLNFSVSNFRLTFDMNYIKKVKDQKRALFNLFFK